MKPHPSNKTHHGIASLWLALGLLLGDALPAAEPVTPLGFAIGQATKSSVTAGLKGKAKLTPDGTNRYSRGAMLKAPGDNLGIEDLEEVLFIFDDKEVLAAVQMRLHKDAMDWNFDTVYERLAAKYNLVTKQVPFVGNKYVRFRQGDAVIDLEAPHMSFTMTVTYMTNAFERAYTAESRREAEEKEKQERRQF